jgi:LacI family transcriptional regulator
MAFNPKMGVRVTTACEMAGLLVPEQVAVLTREEPLLCETAPAPLSAVKVDKDEWGRALVALLKRVIRGETGPERVVIRIPPTGIVARRSTDAPAVSDLRVARALRFLWDHVDYSVNVDDVARAVNTSRSTLERAFSRHFGHGVNAEHRKRKMVYARNLLVNTDLTIAEITNALHFSDRRHLHKAFKAAYGLPPVEYRKQERKGNGTGGTESDCLGVQT